MSRNSVYLPFFDFQPMGKDGPQSADEPELSLGSKSATWRRSGEFVHNTVSNAKVIGMNTLATGGVQQKT